MPLMIFPLLLALSATPAPPSPTATSPAPGAPSGTGTLIVLNKAEATVSLIDLAKGAVVTTVAVGNGPHEVAVSPDGTRAVVANYGNREAPGSTLTVLDVAGGRVEKTIDLGEYRRPHGVAFLPDGRRLAVTAEANQALLVVDVAEGKVVRAIPTGQRVSHMVDLTPDGSRAFVASIGSGTMTAVDLAKGEVIRTLETGAGAEGIAVTPKGDEVWVTNREADTVTVLDARTLEVKRTLKSASFPIRVKVTPDGKSALVSNARSGDLAVFDTASGEERRRIPMKLAAGRTEDRLFTAFGKSPVPIGILIPPDGKLAYVANANADVIAVVDLAKGEVAGLLEAGKEPDGLGWSPLAVAPRK